MEQPPQVFDAWQLVPAGTPNPTLASCLAAWQQIQHFHGFVIRDAINEMIGIQWDTSAT